jgi:hypothetical protein
VTARISSPSLGAAGYQEPGKWTAGVSHRWQYSDRHFVGDVDQVYREKEGSQVINNVHVVDIGLSYAVSKRVTATLSVPFQFATRSQAIRDERTVGGQLVNPSQFPAPNGRVRGAVIDRYTTQADGLSDIKLLGTVWLLDPDRHKKQNVSVGLGVLFPTGEKDAKDTFRTFGTDANGAYQPRAVSQNVDNSIQPGAGAWGIIFDIYSFMEVVTNLTLFASGTYIATPEEDAGVLSGAPPSTTVWSVGDSYLFRAGFGFRFLPKYGLTFTLNGRMEGTPSTDLIGGSGGRRRPGFAISIEPGLLLVKNGWSVSFSTPVALYRNRERDSTDSEGDAAFADWMTLFSVGRSF